MAYLCKFYKKGNTKVGTTCWTFNKLAGGGKIEGVMGTCISHCEGCYNPENPKKSACYVFKSYNQYGGTVIPSHIKNTLMIRHHMKEAFNELSLQIKRAYNKPTMIRVHSSGELQSSKELKMWIELAKKYPEIPFYVYTKNYSVVSRVLRDNSNIPNNFFINISIWHEHGISTYNRWKHLPNVRAFIYDDGYDYTGKIKINCYCPAYNKEGKMQHEYTCDNCKICFQSKAKVCACYAH